MIKLNEESKLYIEAAMDDFRKRIEETYKEKVEEAVDDYVACHEDVTEAEAADVREAVKPVLRKERADLLNEKKEQLECECAIDQLIEMVAEELKDTPMEHLKVMFDFLQRNDVMEAYRGTKGRVAEMMAELIKREIDERTEY